MKRGKDKSAQAGIITTILIIVLVLVSIIIIWNVVRRIIVERSEQIDIGIFTTNLKIDKKQSILAESSIIVIERLIGKGEIIGIKFVVYNESGESETITNYTVINELERKTFNLSAQTTISNINYVEIYPILKTESGNEKVGLLQDSIGESQAGGGFQPAGSCEDAGDCDPGESCSDYTQNQDETGIDCGGTCILPDAETLCSNGADDDKDCLVDCADSDCSGDAACQGTEINSCRNLNIENEIYLLTADDSVTSGTCFNILANNITLDCQGHELGGTSSATGVHIYYFNKTTIKNCIFNVWKYGVYAERSLGTTILDSKFLVNQGSFSGIHLGTSDNNLIRGNNFTYTGSTAPSEDVYGIRNYGGSNNNTLVEKNTFSNLYYGIYNFKGTHITIKSNNFTNNNRSIYSKGISVYSTQDIVIKDNNIADSGEYGIYLRYQQNGQVQYNWVCGSVLNDIDCSSTSVSGITYVGNTCSSVSGCSISNCANFC